MLQHVPAKVTDEMNDSLMAPFKEEEVDDNGLFVGELIILFLLF